MARLHQTLFLLLLLALGGCSNSNPDAPPPGAVHPGGWISAHAAEARDRLAGCQLCHGLDFTGSKAAVSCFNCHPTGPPFTLHPGGWVEVIADHQDFSRTISWTTCATAICHGPTLAGGVAGPSCFNTACHGPDGHPPAPHALPYAVPEAHGPAAKADQFFCRNCHGRPNRDFSGGFVADRLADSAPGEINPAGNCSLCHPSAKAHPTNWQGSNDPDPAYRASHRGVDETAQVRGCALCHLTTGPGTGPLPGAPSCFSANHLNADNSASFCHAGGPRTAPHPVDGSYRAPAAHGRDAKQDLTFCRNCHATSGANPRFNVPFGTLAGGCETCHPPFFAHPETWAGPNQANVFHYLSGNIGNACSMCHGVNLDGVGGVNRSGAAPGLSCRQCHADTALFNLDCTACHGYPPDGITAEPRVAALGGAPVGHGNAAGVGLHDQCAVCHGVKSSATAAGGHLSANAGYRLYDVISGVPGDHWNGRINMNGPAPATGAGYNETSFGCDNAGCHGNDAAHRLNDSALPVQFADYGRGEGGAPHPLEGTFRSGENHGTVARTDLVNCKACHGQAATANPRYNVGIGGNGCETCHNDRTAHPSSGAGGAGGVGVRENVRWYDVQWRHSNGTKSTFATACGMCHPGIGGTGTVGPACLACHRVDPIGNNTGCVSCHSLPPNGAAGIAGNQRPNRTGNHSRFAHRSGISSIPLNTCGVCHGTSFGPGNANHFDQTAGADVSMTGVGAGIAAIQSGGNTRCTGTCHDENHNDESWY